MNAKRPLAAVPLWLRCLLPAVLVLHMGWHAQAPRPSAEADALPLAPPVPQYRLKGLGDALPLAQFTMMWLQAFDRQPGVSLSFRQLDYARVAQWLGLVLELDPKSQYPLLMAARVYGEVQDPARQRLMLQFVAERFEADPAHRWPYMAHATIVAKHRLKDMALALQLARRLRELGEQHAQAVPSWARHMEIAVLEDMGQDEAARILIGGLLQSGRLRDAAELRFLEERLQAPGPSRPDDQAAPFPGPDADAALPGPWPARTVPGQD